MKKSLPYKSSKWCLPYASNFSGILDAILREEIDFEKKMLRRQFSHGGCIARVIENMHWKANENGHPVLFSL